MQAPNDADQIQYTEFKDLAQPDLDSISLKAITEGLESKEWRKNFDALTHLREANKYYGHIMMQELLPEVVKHVIAQVDNLRSNNSKEALTLAHEILRLQNIEKLDKPVICPLVSVLFSKTASEKSFLKKEAVAAVEILPQKYNPHLLEQFDNQTLSGNGQIAELAARILCDYVEANKIAEVDPAFCSMLLRMIHGKRAVVQKKGREILANLKIRLGQQKLLAAVDAACAQKKITEEEQKALLVEIKREAKQVKKQPSLKDYLAQKKKSQPTQ